jgi:hypothetical protein
MFDPLDGSSNLDTGVGVGTIFSILRNDPHIHDAQETVCQPGTRQVAAGYVLYGSSTIFVLTTGNGVALFELDPYIGSFLLVKDKLRIPDTNKVYSVNEAYRESFPDGYRRYLDWAHQNGYSSRYIGSMVADVHRTLLTGGVFMYPPLRGEPDGDDHRAGGRAGVLGLQAHGRAPAAAGPRTRACAARLARRGREGARVRGLRTQRTPSPRCQTGQMRRTEQSVGRCARAILDRTPEGRDHEGSVDRTSSGRSVRLGHRACLAANLAVPAWIFCTGAMFALSLSPDFLPRRRRAPPARCRRARRLCPRRPPHRVCAAAA